MKNYPLVSIITPCYNSEKYLKDTINSVLNQTYSNWEWIIADDGSKDDSKKIINATKDNRIRLIELESNSGAAIARNAALHLAKGRFITFLDSDDVWYSSFLEKSIEFLLVNKVELVYASYDRLNENLEPYLKPFIAEDKITFKRLLYNCPIPMLTSMYDSKRIGKISIPMVEKREDYAMWLEILKQVNFGYAIKEPLAIYRVRDNSYSRNKLEIAKYQFFTYYKYLKLPLYMCIYYTFCWAINGIKKYGNL